MKLKKGDKVIRCVRSRHWVGRIRLYRYSFEEIEILRVGRKYAYYKHHSWEERLPITRKPDLMSVERSEMLCQTKEEVVDWMYRLELEDLMGGVVIHLHSHKLKDSTKEAIATDLGLTLPEKLPTVRLHLSKTIEKEIERR